MANMTLLQAFEAVLTAAKEYIDNRTGGGVTTQPQDEIVLTEYSTNQQYTLKIVNGQPVVQRKN